MKNLLTFTKFIALFILFSALLGGLNGTILLWQGDQFFMDWFWVLTLGFQFLAIVIAWLVVVNPKLK